MSVLTADSFLLDAACRAERVNSRASGGGLAPMEPRPGRLTRRAPWIDFPERGQYFIQPGVIPTPALGLSATILTFLSPPGWDGVIRRISHNYTGPGFVQGSGDLTFGIRKASAFVKGLSAITTEFGTPQQPLDTYILFKESELLEYVVTVSAAAVIPIAGTFIVAYLHGWEYPRE